MSKDLIEEGIIKVLKADDEHNLQDSEIAKLAILISSVARASIDTRLLFYSEISKVMHEVRKRLKKEREDLLNDILGKKKTSILN